jgi:hypothetical protein
MIEVTVSMTIMTVAMALFTAGFLQVYGATNKTESVSTAQAQVTAAFQRLDREVPYAAGISVPQQISGDYYVEYLIANTGTPTCVELRLQASSGRLDRRDWVQGMSPLAPSAWAPLISSVVVAPPFTRLQADVVHNFQRLTVQFAVSAGNGGSASTRQTNVTFVALNTSLTTSSDAICVEGRSV